MNFLYYRGRVGAAALLHALGVGQGDEVAIQAFTCLAVPEFIQALKAKPLYIDIEENGYTMSPESLETRLSEKTKAIIVQHTFGIPARMDRIMAIAEKRGIPVIEDCCHTMASTYDGKLLGTFGVGAFFSFEWGKPIIAGVGGGVVINDQKLQEKLQCSYGNFVSPSFVRRMKLELQYRAFSVLYCPEWFWLVRKFFRLFSKLKVIEGNYHEVGNEVWGEGEFATKISPSSRKRLLTRLKDIRLLMETADRITGEYASVVANVAHPIVPENGKAVFARYPIRVPDKESVLQRARKRNIELADWYHTPIHPIPVKNGSLVDYEPGSCPHAEKRCNEIVSLPVNVRVCPKFIKNVADFFSQRITSRIPANMEFNIERTNGETPMAIYKEMARIHKNEIDCGFLSTFPLSFLASLYRALSDSPHSFAFVAKNEAGVVVGFICGGIDTGKVMKRFLLRNAVRAFPYIFPKVFSIGNFRKIIETLFYPSKDADDSLPPQEILNFCVDSNLQRLGIGKNLFFSLVDEFQQCGMTNFKIVTGESQTKAQRFYESLGAKEYKKIEIHKGTQSLVYLYDIDSSKPFLKNGH